MPNFRLSTTSPKPYENRPRATIRSPISPIRNHEDPYIGWAGDNRIDLATSTDGLNFGDQFLVGTQATYNSYTSIALAATSTTLYLAFAGVDHMHVLNVASSEDGLNFGLPQVNYGIPLYDNAQDANGFPGMICSSSNGAPCPANEVWIGISYDPSTGQFGNAGGGNWLAFLKSLIFGGPPPAAVDSPTLAIGPNSTPLWGATGLTPTGLFDAIYVNGDPLISKITGTASIEASTTGIGMTTLGSTLFLAWVPFPGNDIHINEYQIGTGGYTMLNTIDTGQTCEGNPALLAFNGHVYMYWMGTDSQNTLNAELIQ